MRHDVLKYVQYCTSCQRFKYNNAPTAPPMQLYSVTQPWHTTGIDIMGPFPPTPHQKKFLLVVVDYFTRWIELFALRNTTATDIANILINKVICRYGTPSYILSDNGPQFASQLFNEGCSSLGIDRKFTANYHPQTNMTERVNRTLKAQIAIYAERHPGLWDKEIQKLAFAIRTSVNETTGDTLAYLNFGRDLQTPFDLLLAQPKTTTLLNTPEHKFIRYYRTNLIKTLRLAFEFVRDHAEIKKITQKINYDYRTSNQQFVLGDLVWVQIPTSQIGHNNITHKLRPKYQGPCRLTEQLSPSTFLVTRLSDNVNLDATNINRMKLYCEPQEDKSYAISSASSPPPIHRFPARVRRPPLRY